MLWPEHEVPKEGEMSSCDCWLTFSELLWLTSSDVSPPLADLLASTGRVSVLVETIGSNWLNSYL